MTIDVTERFGENLLRIRQARKLSREALAFRAGIHRTQISLIEGGQRQPLLGTLVKLAGALEVTVETLVEGIVWQPLHRGLGGQFVIVEPPELLRFRG
jgi:transcriptional regulator with XRE-family HTH domain